MFIHKEFNIFYYTQRKSIEIQLFTLLKMVIFLALSNFMMNVSYIFGVKHAQVVQSLNL